MKCRSCEGSGRHYAEYATVSDTCPSCHGTGYKVPKPKEPPMQGESEIRIEHCPKCGTKVLHAGGIGDFCPNPDCDVGDNLLQVKWPIKPPMQGESEIAEAKMKGDLERIMASMPPIQAVTAMDIYNALTTAEARGYERGFSDGSSHDNPEAFKQGYERGKKDVWQEAHDGTVEALERAERRGCERGLEDAARRVEGFEGDVLHIAAAIRALK